MLKRYLRPSSSLSTLRLGLGRRGLADDKGDRPPHSLSHRTEDVQEKYTWEQRSEAAASFCYVTGAATGLVLVTEGRLGYGIVVGCVGCALAELCTLEYKANRPAVIARAASMIVVGVAGFWIIRRVVKNISDLNQRHEEMAAQVAAADKD